jgi:hypothetical protein
MMIHHFNTMLLVKKLRQKDQNIKSMEMRPGSYNGQCVDSRVIEVFVIVAFVLRIQSRDTI